MPERNVRLVARRIRPEEWRELRRLRLEALADTPLAFGPTHGREAAFADAEWQQRAAAAARGEREMVVAAQAHGRWVAMARGSIALDDPTLAYLIGVYVTPEWRRRGLASTLSTEVVDWARERGLVGVLLHVAEWNGAARRTYESLGFVPTGTTERLAHDQAVTELEMRLEL